MIDAVAIEPSGYLRRLLRDPGRLGYFVPPSRVDLFRRLFVAKIAVMDTLDVLTSTAPPPLQGAPNLVLTAVTVLAAIASFTTSTLTRPGLFTLALIRLAGIVFTFPYTINHAFLEFVLLLGLFLAYGGAPLTERDADKVLFARWTQILFLSVWVYAGLQKIVHGAYLDGEFFGLEALADDRGWSLGLSGSLRRVLWLGHTIFGGPPPPSASAAAVTSAIVLPIPGWAIALLFALSFGVVVCELAVPALFLSPKTRRLGALSLAVMQLFIAASSLEIDFALDNFISLALLVPPRNDAPEPPRGTPRPLSRAFFRTTLVLLLAWPLLHMALSSALGFSSWRLFGWGMYATPDIFRTPAVYRLEGGKLAPIEAPADNPAIRAAYKRLHYFEGLGAIHAFAEVYRKASPQPASFPLVVVVTRPRLALAARTLYTSNHVYRVDDAGAALLGRFHTRSAPYEFMIERLASVGP